jgi:hypothetical protein
MSLSLAGDGTLTGVDPALSGFGRVIQVVSTTKTDTFSTTSTTPVDITGATLTITPSSDTSKILVSYSFPVTSSAGDFVSAQLVRDSTVIGGGAVEGSRLSAISRVYNDAADYSSQFNGTFLDSPATTSATTYKLRLFVNGATAYVGRGNENADNANARSTRTALTVTAIEVAA